MAMTVLYDEYHKYIDSLYIQKYAAPKAVVGQEVYAKLVTKATQAQMNWIKNNVIVDPIPWASDTQEPKSLWEQI